MIRTSIRVWWKSLIVIFGLIDPSFGFTYIILFQANLFGVISQNDISVNQAAAPFVTNLFFGFCMYALILIWLESGERLWRRVSSLFSDFGHGLKVSRRDDSRDSYAPDFYREGRSASQNPIVKQNETFSSSDGILEFHRQSNDLPLMSNVSRADDANIEIDDLEMESVDVEIERRHVQGLAEERKISRRQQAILSMAFGRYTSIPDQVHTKGYRTWHLYLPGRGIRYFRS